MRRMFSENQLENKIKNVIETGEVDNAKPIYWHGLDLYVNDPSSITNLSATILNNSEDAINSVDKLKAWFERITGEVDLAVNGVMTYDSSVYNPIRIRKSSNNTYTFYYTTGTGYSSRALDWDVLALSGVFDRRNKLN